MILKKNRLWIQRHPFLSLFFFAFVLRIGSVICLQYQSFSFFTDQVSYLEIAEHLLHGDGMAGTVHRTPFFPAYLALHLWLFPSREWALFAVKCSQAILASFVPLLLVHLGKKLFSPSVGWYAGILCAIEPFLIVVPSFLLTDANYVLLLLIWVILCVEVLQANRYATWLGILTGLITLYRPSHLYLLPFMIFCIGVLQPKLCLQRKRSLVISLCLFLGTLSPWIFRNYQLTNHFVPGTIHLGWLLYVSNSEWADGSAVDSKIQEEAWVQALPPYERDQHYRRLAIQWIQENPSRALYLAGVKFARTWNVVPNFPLLKTFWIQAFSFLALAPLFFFGLWGIFRMPKTLQWGLIFVPLLYYTITHMILLGSVRYRIPVMPYLILFSAFQLHQFQRHYFRKDSCDSQTLPSEATL